MSEIDVTKCKFYTGNDRECIENGEESPLDCDCVEDCYYKQLQALKQENEKLKTTLQIRIKECKIYDMRDKAQQKLDEIEEYITYCRNQSCDNSCKYHNKCTDAVTYISNIIKRAEND